MAAPFTNRPSLIADAGRVGAFDLDPDLMVALGRYLQAGGLPQSLLRVTVNGIGPPIGENLPDIFGRYQLVEDGIWFIPHFPFAPGIPYRASFDLRPLGRSEYSEVLTREFSFPKEQSAPVEVTHIFPSNDDLPENLLRFYVCFSTSMECGRVEAEISLLGPDGEPAPDLLYRAPVELWDKRMQYLTILLDPGRLKRGVGPNRELGPPLKADQMYTLAVGAGMTGLSGARLLETVYKRFRVTEAVREPIAVEDWKLVLPKANSRQPLALIFPCPLDWALLSHTITVSSACEQSLEGQVLIDQGERRWSFAPASPWSVGSYHVQVSSNLEDVCGNSVIAAFDRPLRSSIDLAYDVKGRSIPFDLV